MRKKKHGLQNFNYKNVYIGLTYNSLMIYEVNDVTKNIEHEKKLLKIAEMC